MNTIVRILRQTAVGRQAELVRLLRREGLEATQSSVSRDLREIGVVKGADRYLLPASEDALTPSHFEDVRAFVKGYRGAGTALTVVRTTAGAAQSVALPIVLTGAEVQPGGGACVQAADEVQGAIGHAGHRRGSGRCIVAPGQRRRRA